jgi:hypothetical protein
VKVAYDLFGNLMSREPIRFVIFSSYGNDSCALIQWAHENDLKGVAVVYTDTKWAADGWKQRVIRMELWAQRLGFMTFRTTSIGFRELARQKKGFPTQRFQWCSYILKIEPGERWLEENDPLRNAVCIIGVRRDESQDRATFPEYLVNSHNHGGRVMIAPFATWTEDDRNAMLRRAGIEPLPHRSRECRCINSNRKDMKQFTGNDIAAIREIEAEVGKNMFRPKRHMGAAGIDQVINWAKSKRGEYQKEEAPEEDFGGCNSGYCEQ